jgi:Fe-S oxidoreductase
MVILLRGRRKNHLNCYPDFAARSAAKVKEAKNAADNVVTACPVCFNQLRYTAGAEGIDINVEIFRCWWQRRWELNIKHNKAQLLKQEVA